MKNVKQKLNKAIREDCTCKVTDEQVMEESELIKKNKPLVIKFMKQVAEYLGVEEVPIDFTFGMKDDSRLQLEPTPIILLNNKHLSNINYCYLCVAHEMRHVYKIFAARLLEDELSKIFKDEMSQAKNSSGEAAEYSSQVIEIDAEAFAQLYLKRTLGIEHTIKNDMYQRVLDAYKIKYAKWL